VVSPAFVETFDDSSVTCVARPYRSRDIDGMRLVIAATNDPVGAAAGVRRLRDAPGVVELRDDPTLRVHPPGDRPPRAVIVAVSTQGRSPALAQQLRDHVAARSAASTTTRASSAAPRGARPRRVRGWTERLSTTRVRRRTVGVGNSCR
jgi:siroheme synthase (precorrin-2 oxidase/ferrochelatase)